MKNYSKEIILSPEDLKEAIDYCSDVQWEDVYQDYNLFDLQRHDVKEYDGLGFAKRLQEYSGKPDCVGFYYLKYIPGAFTRVHQDHESSMTIVTLIDSKDLLGGDAIVRHEYKAREGGRPATMKCCRNKNENEKPPYGQEMILDVLPMEVGESLVYGNDLSHGVSLVHEGQRTVLVTWFR
jgi:hypothetical protein